MTQFSPELRDKLHEIRAKVSEIRGIPIHPTAQEGMLTREALASYGRDQFDSLEDEDAADAEASEAMLGLMGLIPPGYTFETFIEEETNIISGVYYFEEDKLVLVGEASPDLSMSEELTIAHEYTHSLQDSRYDLEAYFDQWTESKQEDEGYTSYSETIRCLIEGDAELTQRLYAEEVYGEDWEELAEEQSADEEPIEFDIPDFLLYGFAFYYRDCVLFVEQLYEEGGWDAVNAAYDNPPGTTEQIIDMEKYRTGEWADKPKPASLDGVVTGWTEVSGGQWGQYDTYNYIGAITGDHSLGAFPSYGWSSGWIRLFRNDAEPDRLAAEVRLAWDSHLQAFLFQELFFSDVLDSHGVSLNDVIRNGDVSRWLTDDELNQYGALVGAEADPSIRLIFATDEAALDTFLSLE